MRIADSECSIDGTHRLHRRERGYRVKKSWSLREYMDQACNDVALTICIADARNETHLRVVLRGTDAVDGADVATMMVSRRSNTLWSPTNCRLLDMLVDGQSFSMNKSGGRDLRPVVVIADRNTQPHFLGKTPKLAVQLGLEAFCGRKKRS
jgi:hypothetical protein